jgi:hypothetical protein
MRPTRKRTPAECIGGIIKAAMSVKGFTADDLADLAQIHRNTVYRDLKDPDRMQASRMWLYFVALDVPVDEALNAFADSFARSLVTR